MGGFTVFYLKNTSEENIAKQNAKLTALGVPKKYRFYSEGDIMEEYEWFKKEDGVFPEHLFPRAKIHSYEQFKCYWNPKAVGEVFVPYVGSLTLDCYFGRTSKRAMRNIGKYLADNHREIKSMSGSYDTFMERGMTKLERQIISESGILQN